MNVKRFLVVVDMQNDFITGSLGTKEAEAIIPNVISKIQQYDSLNIFATRDTHTNYYFQTQEGKNLPIKHCIKNTEGWQLHPKIQELISNFRTFNNDTFASVVLALKFDTIYTYNVLANIDIEIELVGLCTDICVVLVLITLTSYRIF